jgi:hypothetical protein
MFLYGVDIMCICILTLIYVSAAFGELNNNNNNNNGSSNNNINNLALAVKKPLHPPRAVGHQILRG